MRDYENLLFGEIIQQVRKTKEIPINIKILEDDFILLQYFLTRNLYYAIIVDDYKFEIYDKNSLLEALYYQIRLITINNLNWDALQEGLGDALNHLLEFEGICILFKKGSSLKNKLPVEFKMLVEIIQDINRQDERRQIKVLMS